MILISWHNFGSSGTAIWEGAVEDVHAYGFRAVVIAPVRFVDTATGQVRLSDGITTGPSNAHVAAAIARAKALGMAVTVTPFIEPDGFAMWRGELNFAGAAAERFWDDYGAYLVEVATFADAHGADRVAVGTELRTLVRDPRHNDEWATVIAAVDAVFDGMLGYASNWDTYRDPNLTATIWENPQIDFMGVDAYHPLATVAQASGAGAPSVSTLLMSWKSVLDNPDGGLGHGVLPFAAARKGGAGMPCVLTEHGSIPYDATTTQPFSTAPAANDPDPREQRNDYDALLQAADQRAAVPLAAGRLAEIDFWHWGMPGGDGSLWLLDPEGDAVAGGAHAAQFLSDFVSEASNLPALCADADGNGSVDVIDAANVARAAVGLPSVCGDSFAACDVDGSDTIDVIDAANVARAAVGLPNVCQAVEPIPVPTATAPPQVVLVAPHDDATVCLDAVAFEGELRDAAPGTKICFDILTDKGTNPCDGDLENVFRAGDAPSRALSLDPVFYTNARFRWAIRATTCTDPTATCDLIDPSRKASVPLPCEGVPACSAIRDLHTIGCE